jgi:hypothetical protein
VAALTPERSASSDILSIPSAAAVVTFRRS